MTGAAAAVEVARFRQALARSLGWIPEVVESTAGSPLADVLRARAADHGWTVTAYLRELEERPTGSELGALAEALAVTETYFFRHVEQFRALRDLVIPDRMRACAGRRRLRLVSVGCSSGEEPYTLAIVAREALADPSWEVSVLGLDVNPATLRQALAARYPVWSLRETPEPVRRRWFHPHGDVFEVDERIRADVRFQLHNATTDDPLVWPADAYDVVFCRNLLMYLTPDVAGRLIERITRSLAPGGYLFLGHTDTLGSRPSGLSVRYTDGAFFYQRVAPTAPAPPAPVRAAVPVPGRPAVRTAPVRAADVEGDLTRLLREERHAEALALVGSAPQTRELELVRGVLLLHRGRVDEARGICTGLLDRGGPDADTQHLLGTIAEVESRPEVAAEQHRLAAYLDPRFAMPHLRLGLLARHDGDHRVATAELERAAALLPRETDRRILLFGGGFSRQTLLDACRRDSDACRVAR